MRGMNAARSRTTISLHRTESPKTRGAGGAQRGPRQQDRVPKSTTSTCVLDVDAAQGSQKHDAESERRSTPSAARFLKARAIDRTGFPKARAARETRFPKARADFGQGSQKHEQK